MSTRSLKYGDAVQIVLQTLKARSVKEPHPELEAAVCHWLMNGMRGVPFLRKSQREYAEETLKASVGAAKSGYRVAEKAAQLNLTLQFSDIPYPPPEDPKFTFIDLFAGIGGFRQAMQSVGGKCVFSSEWDKYAKQTYFANYGEMPYGDIQQIKEEWIPDHDVLCAGFPCQPFSLAGVSKKNSMGRKHGFADETQGTLFFDIARILKKKRPKAFFLENVKNLLTHDSRQTFEVIRRTLEDDLSYVVNWKIVDAAAWVPQHRERLFIVGYDPKQIDGISKADINIPGKPRCGYRYPKLNKIIQSNVDPKHILGPGTWATLERHKANHAAKGNGFGYGLHPVPIAADSVTRTISARYHKDGAEVLIGTGGDRPRRLTVEEAQQLQGYDPKRFRFPVSDTQAYRQIGNSVAVPAIKAVANEIVKVLEANKCC
ncbi:MAG: DNA (cytosine-5-)-methyltransferase [Kiritimatiellales bacterium]|nr:DNA (cytosine-5-)-methyltransferase [Kiritimatiellales bacterium]